MHLSPLENVEDAVVDFLVVNILAFVCLQALDQRNDDGNQDNLIQGLEDKLEEQLAEQDATVIRGAKPKMAWNPSLFP